jgi:predicted nucleic acid-binding protein
VIVLDASVVLELMLRSTAARAIEARIFRPRETLHVPHLLDVEVAHVLRRYVSRGELDAERGRQSLELLGVMPLRRYAHQALLPRMWQLRQNLTAPDSAYVALAESLGAVLLTRDERLVASAGHAATIEFV